MSHKFRKPKMHINEGSLRSRLIRAAQKIPDQETLDRIMAAAPPAVGVAWLHQVRDHLKFTPQDETNLQEAPK